jgi:hypothetical protein
LIRNNRRLALLDAVNKEEVELLGERFVFSVPSLSLFPVLA